MQNNLDGFGFNDTWCVTKSLPDGTLSVLQSEGLSESRNQLESMRFRYPKPWKQCNDARAKVLQTGKTESFLSMFEDVSNRFSHETDVIIVYQIWGWDEKFKDHDNLRPELYQGMYREAWNKYVEMKCDLIVCH